MDRTYIWTTSRKVALSKQLPELSFPAVHSQSFLKKVGCVKALVSLTMQAPACLAVTVSAAFTAIAGVTVFLRLYTRVFLVRCPGFEDYAVLLAFVSSLASSELKVSAYLTMC